MADQIRITTDCDGLRTAHPDAEKLYRIGARSVLLLLRDDDRDYYKVAFSGEPVWVPKSCGVRVESEQTREYALTVREPEPEPESELVPALESAASAPDTQQAAASEPDALEDEIARRTAVGWQLISRTGSEAQMRRKPFSIGWFLAWTIAGLLFTFWVYPVWYLVKPDELIFLRVANGQLALSKEPCGFFRWPTQFWRSYETEVSVPVEEVFSYLAHFGTLHELLPGSIQSVEKTSEGPVGVGSTCTIVKHGWGAYGPVTTQINVFVTEFVPNERIAFEERTPTVRTERLFQVERCDGDTRITMHLEEWSRAVWLPFWLLILLPLMVILFPLVLWMDMGMLRRLKSRLESQ